MRRLRRTAGLFVTALAGLTVLVGASGWLYLIQPHSALPGTPIADALPLDELSRRSAVPLIVFVGVWAAAGLVLGLLARLARLERLTAALVLALGVGLFTFAATGFSVLVVRQIPALAAFHSAARMPAVYIPAALAGLGGALVGWSRQRDRRMVPRLLAVLVAFAGIVDIFVAAFPEGGPGLIEQLAPHVVQGISEALVAPLGVGLLVIARGLARRKQRAWQLAVAMLGGSAVLHLVHSVHYSAMATALIALALIAQRQDFRLRGDRSNNRRIAMLALVFVAAIYSYGAVALWVNRVMADQPYTGGFVVRETSAALMGLTLRGSTHLSGGFAQWFPPSVLLLGFAAAAILLVTWLAPWRYRLSQQRREREQAHTLVERFGIDTLAPFALRGDKSYFFSEDERAFLAYKVVAGVAVVSGDPVGPANAVPMLLARFLAFARARDWRVAVLGAGERYLDLYRAAGLRALYHGEEAVVHTCEFSLKGRAIRKVRQSVTRLEREGYRAEVLYARDVDTKLRAELEEIFEEWRGEGPTKGFTMELDTLFRLDADDALFFVGRDASGIPQGFLHFVVACPARALSLSSMPRRPETPNGFNEWLAVTAIAWAKSHDFERVSMNFAPFAAVLAPEHEQELTAATRMQRRALKALKGHGFQLENLLVFNRKFFPHWEPRYVIYQRPVDLPRVGLAGLAAEGYLPRTGTRT
ncbi:MAG: phosphatidylglycerol lysyltransferase domain-containing protein [Actinomycetota bacterium]|nr:phosphatidylglycerol lysyltransferase domain-containing protein [Actinomycetota bacterium]